MLKQASFKPFILQIIRHRGMGELPNSPRISSRCSYWTNPGAHGNCCADAELPHRAFYPPTGGLRLSLRCWYGNAYLWTEHSRPGARPSRGCGLPGPAVTDRQTMTVKASRSFPKREVFSIDFSSGLDIAIIWWTFFVFSDLL